MTTLIIYDTSARKVYKYFDRIFETKFDFLFIFKDSYLFLIGEDEDDIAILYVYRIDELIKGKADSSKPSSIQDETKVVEAELLTRAVCYYLHQNYLFVGGNKGELIYYVIDHQVGRNTLNLDKYYMTSEPEKITNINIYKIIKSKDDDRIELIVTTENYVNIHLVTAYRNDSSIIYVDTSHGADLYGVIVNDNFVYVACKKEAKIKCYNREHFKYALHCDYQKLKMVKQDKYIGVLLNDLEHEKQLFEMISSESEHRHKGLILKDFYIKAVQILMGKVYVFFTEKEKLKYYILKELDIKGKIEELKKKNFYTYAIDLAKDHLAMSDKGQIYLRDLYKEYADRNYSQDKHNNAIQYYIKAAEIDNNHASDSEYIILDPFIVINKYKNIGRSELCTYLEKLFLQFKQLYLKQYMQHKEQYKLLINYLVNHLVATNCEDTLIKILNEEDVRKEIDMEQFNKVCSNNMNRQLSEKVFKMNKDYELLAVILVEDRDFKSNILYDVLAHIKDKPRVSRARVILSFILKYFFVLQLEYPHELMKFIKETFLSSQIEPDLIESILECDGLDDKDIYDILEIIIFKYNNHEPKYLNEFIKICIINHKKAEFKSEQEIIELLSEWDKYLDTEDMYMACITYDYDLGIEKYAFKQRDYIFLYEYYNKIQNYDKLVTTCRNFYKDDKNIVYMVLRSLVHSNLKPFKIDQMIRKLITDIDCDLDWAIIINTIKLNSNLHLSCIKSLMQIKLNKENIQLAENLSYILNKETEARIHLETSRKLCTLAIKFVYQSCSLCRNELDSGRTVVFRCGHEVHYECMDNMSDISNSNSNSVRANNSSGSESQIVQCPCCVLEKGKIYSQYNSLYSEKVPDIKEFLKQMESDYEPLKDNKVDRDLSKKDNMEISKDKILVLAEWLSKDLWRDVRYHYKVSKTEDL